MKGKRLLLLLLYFLSVEERFILCARAAPKIPEASSTLLKMHQKYVRQSPHDCTLYDSLEVSPNATNHEISKAYRRLSRRFHPDKATIVDGQDSLERVRQAFEVLKDDSTRLPYHKYGLLESSNAVAILSGNIHNPNRREIELLKLMGFNPTSCSHNSASRSIMQQERAHYLAGQILEKIRPLVEETIDEVTLATVLTKEFDQLKRLPMGSHILRCVGRAYRYSGRQALRCQSVRTAPLPKAAFALTNSMRSKVRSAKYLLTAAVAAGHVVVTDRLVNSAKSLRNPSSSLESIAYFDDTGDISDIEAPTDEEIKAVEMIKARSAVAGVVQVEALWKITKIELDQIVREACTLILHGEHFFFATRQAEIDGWVGSRGNAVNADVAHARAAAALEMLGNLMVERSKDSTSWME